jgi:thiamine-phosphate pyrophosphorylase
MEGRQRSWPRVWLVTDERMGDRLWDAIERAPEGAAGIVFRHYGLGLDVRRALARRVAARCKARALTIAIAADEDLAIAVAADLVHNPRVLPKRLPFSRSAHSIDEAEQARAEGASLVFVSPVYATRSHPGQSPLGFKLAVSIAQAAAVPAIALGGMDAARFAQFEREGFYGWGGIDAWIRR